MRICIDIVFDRGIGRQTMSLAAPFSHFDTGFENQGFVTRYYLNQVHV